MASTNKESQESGLDVAYEISKILDCGLDKEILSVCIGLLETGINPEALAEVITQLRQQSAEDQNKPAQSTQPSTSQNRQQ